MLVVTIPVAPIITGIIVHFRFHIRIQIIIIIIRRRKEPYWALHTYFGKY